MRLPEIQLDDRRFQDLVSEARTRIARACPEWTEHNVSDPGITLIELFAWMTEMTIYRLNRVPDKLHVALLDLLGIRLDGPSAATTSLRFRLADKPTESILIEGGNTEVGTPRTAHDESVIFQVDEDFTIPAMAPAAYVLQRHGQVKDVGLADGEARPQGSDQLAFGSPPQVGDALYLGFEEPLDRLIVQIEVDASQARGAGVNPEDPPLRWEVSQPDGEWAPATVLEDLTGGFNYGSGTVELELPPRSVVAPLGGHRLHWLRCRIAETSPSGRTGATYSHAPEIYSISAGADGRPAARDARRAHRARDRRRLRRHARPDLPAAQPAGAQAADGRDARGPGPRVRRLGALGVAPGLRRLDRVRPPLRGRPRLGRGRARPGDPRDARRLDAVRRRPAQGRGPALHALPPRRRARRQRHGGHAERAQEHDRRHRHRDQPGRRDRRRRRRDHHPRAPARVDGDPLALPRGHRRGLRVHGRRGEPARRARGLHPAARRRRRCRCTSSRASTPPTAGWTSPS